MTGLSIARVQIRQSVMASLCGSARSPCQIAVRIKITQIASAHFLPEPHDQNQRGECRHHHDPARTSPSTGQRRRLSVPAPSACPPWCTRRSTRSPGRARAAESFQRCRGHDGGDPVGANDQQRDRQHRTAATELFEAQDQQQTGQRQRDHQGQRPWCSTRCRAVLQQTPLETRSARFRRAAGSTTDRIAFRHEVCRQPRQQAEDESAQMLSAVSLP